MLLFLLKKLYFYQIIINHRISTLPSSPNSLVVSIFINDIKVISPKKNKFIIKVKVRLIVTFQITKMRLISFSTGFRIDCNRGIKTIKLSQQVYTKNLHEKFFLNKVNTFNITIR